MSKRIALLGYYGHGNLGDEAILEGIKQYLRDLDAKIDIQVLSDFPDRVQKEHDVSAYKQIQPLIRGSNNPIRFLTQLMSNWRLIKESDLLIVGGGGLYQDYYRKTPYGLWEILLAKILGKPVILFSVGVGPYSSKMGKFLTHIILKQVDLFTVRDEFSMKEAIGMGFRDPVPQMVRDPVISLNLKDNIESIDIGREEGPLFGISVRPWFIEKDYKSTIAEVSDELISRYNGKVIFIPLHFGRDENIMHEIRGMMRCREQARIIETRYSVFQLMDIIGKMDIIIGMRLHSLIFAAKMGVPFLGLVYDPKVSSFANELNMDSYTIEISNVGVEDLLNMIDRIYENKEELKIRIRENMERIEAEAKEQLGIIADKLEGSG